ncbi:hypothetical protein IV203_038398 [Nitzschia inconspicua]|uniref:Uncharacterized protein n=1 Tax=Nitzschia inconspicua TaxID=303405 RepID=A0A9K3LMJ0_9STRA|nr:hypothetical protein IV203_038398 [Nitzschia inconspicua]
MARFKWRLPMNPLGHMVSEMSSTETTSGDEASDDEENASLRVFLAHPRVKRDDSAASLDIEDSESMMNNFFLVTMQFYK